MKIYVIIINYKSFDDTVATTKSVLSSDGVEPKVIIIDNGSPDGSGNKLFQNYKLSKQVKVIMLNANMGFGAANNYGLSYAFSRKADYALLLNNDTIVDRNMINELINNTSPGTLLAPVMLYYDDADKIWFGGGRFDWWKAPRHEYQNKSIVDIPQKAYKTDWLTGCCMLIPASAFAVTGGFDPGFFLYWEDVDWSIRLSRMGYQFLMIPTAKLWHKVSASTGGPQSPISQYYGMRNRFYMYRKLGMGIRPKLLSYMSLVRGFLLDNSKCERFYKAFKDYRSGRMGHESLV